MTQLFRYILCTLGRIPCGNIRYAKGTRDMQYASTCNRWKYHFGLHCQKKEVIRTWEEGVYYD